MLATAVNLLAQSSDASTRIDIPSVDFFTIAPEIALFSAALVIILIRSFFRQADVGGVCLGVALAGLTASAGFTWWQWKIIDLDGQYQSLSGAVAMDGFGVFVKTVVLGATLLALLIANGYLRREGLEKPEYFALMLMSATGMVIMASANDLIAIFVALEVLSIALYVLAAFDRTRLESQEAGLKYFILGAFSSAVFLYGIALTYGATGSTNLLKIAQFLFDNPLDENALLLLGFALLLVGLGFKVAAAPFHMWTPDVYEGAPTPVTAFMASATKIAAFAALLRIFMGAFFEYRNDWHIAIFGLATASLVIGSVGAIVQTDVKRMLAYSSISHAGYALIGLTAATESGVRAVLFYLFVYAAMVLGSFAVVSVVSSRGDSGHALSDYRGLAQRHPALAGLFTFFLLSQAGVPLTGGFIAKFVVFKAAVDAGEPWLALIGTLAAAVGAFVYLRIVVTMWAGTDTDTDEHPAPVTGGRFHIDRATGLAMFVCAVVLLVSGVLPEKLLDFAEYANLLF